MTTYTGARALSSIWPDTAPAGPSHNIFDVNLTPTANTVYGLNTGYGTKTYGDAGVHPAGVSKTGFKLESFVDDYYDRIHIIPASIDLGNLVTNTERSISIWNAWRISRTISSIVGVGVDGLSIAGIPATPYTMLPLKYDTYTLQASTDGPPNVLASYRFTFTHGEEPTLDVTGRRILVFPYKPNWANGMSETIEFKTDVLRSYDGSEQRRALRVNPRRGFEYDFHAVNRDAQRLESLIWGWGYRNFTLPVWTDGTTVTADAPAGSTTLICDTTTKSFRPGDFAVVYQDSSTYEAVQVYAVDDTFIWTQYPLQFDWPAGTRLYPAIVAHLPQTIGLQRYTDTVVAGRATFTSSADETYANLPDAAAPVTYDGLEVIMVQPDWKEPLSNEFTRETKVTDSGVGPVGYYVKETYPRIVRPFRWLLRTRQEILDFRAFVARMRGQVKTCWIPSWHDDFHLAATVQATATSIKVEGIEFSDLVGVDTNRDRLMIVLNDGSIYYRRITDTTLDGDITVFGINANFGRIINPSDVKRIHILLKCRLASDKIEIPWQTDSIATPQVVFTTVKA